MITFFSGPVLLHCHGENYLFFVVIQYFIIIRIIFLLSILGPKNIFLTKIVWVLLYLALVKLV
jgi:hypothetical protein